MIGYADPSGALYKGSACHNTIHLLAAATSAAAWSPTTPPSPTS